MQTLELSQLFYMRQQSVVVYVDTEKQLVCSHSTRRRYRRVLLPDTWRTRTLYAVASPAKEPCYCLVNLLYHKMNDIIILIIYFSTISTNAGVIQSHSKENSLACDQHELCNLVCVKNLLCPWQH